MIWVTGYRVDHSWIELPVTDEEGALRHRRGVTEVPGLYFLGLSWQHTRGSALLGFIADDAFIAARSAAEASPPPSRTTLAPRTQRAPRKGLRKWNITRITNITGTSTASRSSIISDGDGGPARGDRAPGRRTRRPRQLRAADRAGERLGDDTTRMIAYNGSVPGPAIRVREGSELVVDVVNEGDLEATVHWHGLRLENRYDGTHETQALIPVGGSFSYRISFPIPVSTGTTRTSARTTARSWAVRQHRRGSGRARLLAGRPPRAAPDLDDVLIEDGKIAPFKRQETTFAVMGRYGNVLLVDGETNPTFSARQGEVVRLYLTNTANTRASSNGPAGSAAALVGGDSGRVEHEEFAVESVVFRTSERIVVDALFEQAGRLTLEHRTPERMYQLATIEVGDEPATPPLADQFANLGARTPSGRQSGNGWHVTSTRSQTRHSHSSPRWIWACQTARSSTPARCTPRSPARASDLLQVRHEAHRGRRAEQLRLPDAPGGRAARRTAARSAA